VAWKVLNDDSKTGTDAVVTGCSTCEDLQCDGTVGYGGSPDENGETTLDAMIFEGDTMNMGAVGGLRKIKHAISTAKYVLQNTEHSILVGSLATEFSKGMGFKEESLSTRASKNMWIKWKENKCQPNFWFNVHPDSSIVCGPYKPLHYGTRKTHTNQIKPRVDSMNHDTISMAVISKNGSIVVGTSSNGAKYKIPGRMGDAPLPGAGAYADTTVGAGLATGDGDVMMRFLPSFLMVEMMRNGTSPKDASTEAIRRITKYYPKFSGAVIAVNKKGKFSAACHGIPEFPFSVASPSYPEVTVLRVKCFE
ncbi:hypothetical protein AAG570_007739, partial [Ranatra chinensis]